MRSNLFLVRALHAKARRWAFGAMSLAGVLFASGAFADGPAFTLPVTSWRPDDSHASFTGRLSLYYAGRFTRPFYQTVVSITDPILWGVDSALYETTGATFPRCLYRTERYKEYYEKWSIKKIFEESRTAGERCAPITDTAVETFETVISLPRSLSSGIQGLILHPDLGDALEAGGSITAGVLLMEGAVKPGWGAISRRFPRRIGIGTWALESGLHDVGPAANSVRPLVIAGNGEVHFVPPISGGAPTEVIGVAQELLGHGAHYSVYGMRKPGFANERPRVAKIPIGDFDRAAEDGLREAIRAGLLAKQDAEWGLIRLPGGRVAEGYSLPRVRGRSWATRRPDIHQLKKIRVLLVDLGRKGIAIGADTQLDDFVGESFTGYSHLIRDPAALKRNEHLFRYICKKVGFDPERYSLQHLLVEEAAGPAAEEGGFMLGGGAE